VLIAGTNVQPLVPALEKIWADSLGQSLADFNFRCGVVLLPLLLAAVAALLLVVSRQPAGSPSKCTGQLGWGGCCTEQITCCLKLEAHQLWSSTPAMVPPPCRTVTSKFNELVYQYPIRIPERYSLVIR
jgi:hypothetical protein